MGAQRKVYVVTEGAYDEYRIMRVFLSRSGAQAFVDAYNAAAKYNDAEVEEFDVAPDDFKPVRFARFSTNLFAGNGAVHSEGEVRGVDWDSQYGKRAKTTVDESRGMVRIRTAGPEVAARQAHSDAVAKRRAEIMGL